MASNQPNTQLPAPTAGIKLAKPGFNANTAGNYELLFDTSWPSLAVAYSQTVTFPGGGGVGHIDNPLGFPAFVMAWASVNGVLQYRHFPQTSKDKFYFTDIGAVNTVYFLEAYNLDISKQVSYNFIQPPTIQVGGKYDPSYGVKFAKPHKKITSTDLNDFIFHSRAQSPAILAVVTDFDKPSLIGGSQTITYENPYNYVPWAFGYADESSSPGIYTYAPPYAEAEPRLFVNTYKPNSFTLSGASDVPHMSLIMLRDPLFVANTQRVVYG